MQAMEVLLQHGVPEERILFLNIVASPEGLRNVYEKCVVGVTYNHVLLFWPNKSSPNFSTRRFPKIRVICAWVDDGLDEHNYIVPGLGDFGNRYWSG